MVKEKASSQITFKNSQPLYQKTYNSKLATEPLFSITSGLSSSRIFPFDSIWEFPCFSLNEDSLVALTDVLTYPDLHLKENSA